MIEDGKGDGFIYSYPVELPHFHIVCSGREVVVLIDTLQVLEGDIDKRALVEGLTWAAEHQPLLRRTWADFH